MKISKENIEKYKILNDQKINNDNDENLNNLNESLNRNENLIPKSSNVQSNKSFEENIENSRPK